MFCFENRKHVFANKTCAKIEDERHANVTNIKTSHLVCLPWIQQKWLVKLYPVGWPGCQWPIIFEMLLGQSGIKTITGHPKLLKDKSWSNFNFCKSLNQGSTYFDLKVVMPFSKAKTETLLYPNHFEIFEINKELEMLLCTFFKTF